MKYYVFALKFLTPVHFGDTAAGGKLDKISLTCSADTYFSALCNELASGEDDIFKEIVSEVKLGKLKLSSLFPYQLAKNELMLYLPKPLYRSDKEQKLASTYEKIKEQATKLKSLKKASYVRASNLGILLKGVMKNESVEDKVPQFSLDMLVTRVNKRGKQPLPYYVGATVFNASSGLYFLLGLENDAMLDEVTEAVKLLGLEGIGGKRSSGYGKYELLTEPIALKDGSNAADINALATMLPAEDAGLQIAIAPQTPVAGQTELLKSGFYRLSKRSGFVNSRELEDSVKYSSYFVVAEGSVFAKRPEGQLLELGVPGLSYNILRNGVGMYVGVDVDEQ